MEGAPQRDVPRALLQRPLDSLVVDDPEGVEVVLGEKVLGIVEFFRLLQSAEQVVRLADRHDGMSRARRRHVACLFDLLPGDGSRLNHEALTIQTGE